MYFPPPWHNSAPKGAVIEGDEATAAAWRPDTNWERVFYTEPEDMEMCENSYCSYYMFNGDRCDFYSNYTHVPVEPFLPQEMYHNPSDSAGYEHFINERHPFSAPGTARVFGNGCGVPGGNPWGCWYNDQLPYGYCSVINDNVSYIFIWTIL